MDKFDSINVFDTTTSGSGSDSEEYMPIWGEPSTNANILNIDLEDGSKYAINLNANDIDICCQSDTMTLTGKDVLTILKTIGEHPDFIESAISLSIIVSGLDDSTCNCIVDMLKSFNFKSLKYSTLYGVNVNKETFANIINFVSKNSLEKLEEFTLGKVDVGDDAFINALKTYDLGGLDNLKALLLPEIGLTDKSKDVILYYISSEKNKDLGLVSLLNNHFSEAAKKEILEASKKRKGFTIVL